MDDIDNCGTTPLMDAVRNDSTVMFGLLVHYGAKVTQCNKLGYNCLHIAAEAGAADVIIHLMRIYNFDINALTEQGSMTAMQIAKKVRRNGNLLYSIVGVALSIQILINFRKNNALR